LTTDSVFIHSPIDGRLVATRKYASPSDINRAIDKSLIAQQSWQQVPVAKRAQICMQAIAHLNSVADEIAEEITLQMGRPIMHSGSELSGVNERASYMTQIAESALSDVKDDSAEITRIIRRVAHGTALVIAPWNFPYLTAINSIIPLLVSGNAVILKHASQTLLCAERFQQAFSQADLPSDVFQHLILDHDSTFKLAFDPSIKFVTFTGSVAAGAAIERSLAGQFKTLCLELGGKDPAYVCPDANLGFTVEQLADGVLFNAGQSCCAIERIYLHQAIYHEFIERFISCVEKVQLGNPLNPQTTLGPMVNIDAANHVREQIANAVKSGARTSINTEDKQTLYVGPQILLDVDHTMDIMKTESFGPVVGIMKVDNDEQAIALMNDSQYGLTVSIWTSEQKKALAIGQAIDTGTVFMNRCDYLDPRLAWVGVKNSGRGCSLSSLAYHQVTRAKSFHLRTIT